MHNSLRRTSIVGLRKIAMAQRDFSAAVAHLERALKLQPGATAIHYSLAMAYRGLGDLNQAQAHLEERGEDLARVDDPLIAELPPRLHDNLARYVDHQPCRLPWEK